MAATTTNDQVRKGDRISIGQDDLLNRSDAVVATVTFVSGVCVKTTAADGSTYSWGRKRFHDLMATGELARVIELPPSTEEAMARIRTGNPCQVCGKPDGGNMPSRVCSEECLRKGQGFTPEPAAEVCGPRLATETTEPPVDAKPAKKARKTPKAKPEAKERKMSAIDAAAQVLATTGKPMNCQDLIDAMGEMKLWDSPKGLTPHATLYSAILREIKVKGDQARFMKADRGQFALRT